MSVEDIDDPILIKEVAIRLEQMLAMVCAKLERENHLGLLPDNVFDWWEREKEVRAAARRQAEEEHAAARHSALAKLTPEERRALGLED